LVGYIHGKKKEKEREDGLAAHRSLFVEEKEKRGRKEGEGKKMRARFFFSEEKEEKKKEATWTCSFLSRKRERE